MPRNIEYRGYRGPRRKVRIDSETHETFHALRVKQKTTVLALMYEGYALLLTRHGFQLPEHTKLVLERFCRPLPNIGGLPRWAEFGTTLDTRDVQWPVTQAPNKILDALPEPKSQSLDLDIDTFVALQNAAQRIGALQDALHIEAMSLVLARYDEPINPKLVELLNAYKRPRPEMGFIPAIAPPG